MPDERTLLRNTDMPETPLRFGPFTLHPQRRQLLQDGTAVQIGSRALDVLLALIEGRDRTMSKRELIQQVWAGQAVEENNLTVTISSLRKVLREQEHGMRLIQTVSGRGYRFVGDVGRDAPAGAGRPVPAEVPSIAVLPFKTLGGQPDAEHIGQGIAQDIISELSRNRWLTVIARNSSFSFRDGPVDAADVARQFDVRYVLEGTVRAAGTRLRITAQLIDATTNTHLLAERYDRELDDIFSAQDEITERIITAVRPALMEAEQERSLRKHPDSVDAWAACQRGIWHFSRFEHPETVEAKAWFQRAIDLDPRFAPGYYGLAVVHLHDGSAWVPTVEPDWQVRGECLALQAVLLDDRDSGAHSVLGLARMVRGDHDGALAATVRALDLNPNDATAHGTQGATLVFHSRPLEGLAALARAVRLSPRDPRMRIRLAHTALGHYFARQYEPAEAVARTIIARWPDYAFGPRMLTIILAETNRIAEARTALQDAVRLFAAPFDDFSHARMPWYKREDHARALAALRLAGWTGRAD